MNKNHISPAGSLAAKRGTSLLLALALAWPLSSWAGGIRGILKTDQGRPIGKAKVCLLTEASAADGWKCIKKSTSAKNGKYVLVVQIFFCKFRETSSGMWVFSV